ncbi:MAG: 30S ribosomal protein S4 [Candidatus Hadarchaeota archaeon]|nr:30S ribosomal protein S4 [Candidatus Hadarchaeota archaeon]
MGDPRKQRKKYRTPLRPWEKDRMDEEDRLIRRYGLRRKEEIWRAETVLRSFRRQARRLLAASGEQVEKEARQFLGRLQRLGLVRGENLDDVLGLTIESVLDRHLQAIVHKKGLARTPRQARQLITHGHITVEGRRVTVPSYLVSVGEEGKISHSPGSSFVDRLKPPEPPEAAEAEGE